MSAKASSDFGLYKEKQKTDTQKFTRFIVVVTVTIVLFLVIFYVAMFIGNLKFYAEKALEATIEKPPPTAEKLVSSETIRMETYKNEIPKPFRMTYKGPPPSEFSISSTTEKITTLHYPQTNQRYKNYPKNIQEIIGYSYNRPVGINPNLPAVYARNYKSSSTLQASKNFTYNDNDPFHLFKPEDPGDVNLLATRNVRFAPPPWANLRKTNSKAYKIPQLELQENSNRKGIITGPKPLAVTLNIYPDKENEIRDSADYRYGVKNFIKQRMGYNIQPRVRFPDDRSKKMVIHVNVYPDEVGSRKSTFFKKIINIPSAI